MTSYDADRAALRALFDVGLKAADPAVCVPPHLPAPPEGRTIVIAAGKAAASMARAVEDNFQGHIEGIAVTRYGHGTECRIIEVIEASHPVPDDRGEVAARKLMQTVTGLGPDDLVLCLISGGGSALLGLPAEGLTLKQKKAINKALLASGAPIGEMNTVRKHLSAIKGGRLAQAAHPARVVTLGISDVPGDDPSVIASGPTVADKTTLADALDVIARFSIAISEEVRAHLDDPGSETPKPGDPVFEGNSYVLIARPADMVEAVARAGRLMGYDVISLGADIEGEAREVGKAQARMALDLAEKMKPDARPVLIVSGGETTVTVDRPGGRGGRNCEYLLALAVALDGDPRICALACDTDGIDGSEDNAGAIIDPGTLYRAEARGLKPAKYLADHDSYTLFSATGDLVMTGPTLTNVNDLRLILISPPKVF
ncbi:glycerate kinase [Pseudohoeflea suaedae]|uniref:Glycerate kinase n=1 Tax=Pseudohoeflea suaedae TaxID=877384 RepID=A0A4R5PPF8_9HYPH|nr:glycerate kinase [Pseudohoeflea suaedae]TDH38497.1 glycerate kinase [Pseudohoeflea suaedae]